MLARQHSQASRLLNLLLLGLLPFAMLVYFFPVQACFAANEPSLDKVIFVNGDRLSGEFIEANHDTLTFAGSVTGTLSIRWNLVKRLELGKEAMAVTSQKNPSTGSVSKLTVLASSMEIVGADFLVTSDSGSVDKFPLAEFISAAPNSVSATPASSTLQGPLSGWRGMFQTQDSLVGATQKKYDLGATLHIARPTKEKTAFRHQVSDITLQASFGEAKKPGASPVRTVLYEAVMQQNVYLTNKSDWYGFGLANFYHNLSLGMNLEQAYGGGIGWDSYHEKHVYGFAADIRYVNEDIYAPGNSVRFAASALSEHYSYTFPWPKKKPINFYERITFIPAFNENRAFQVRGLTGLDLPLTPKLSIGLQQTDDYLRNAPANSNQNYSKVQLSIKYSFGAPL